MLLEHLHINTAQQIKKLGYLIFLVPLSMPALAYVFGQNSDYPVIWAALSFLLVFVAVPILDLVLGKDPVNPEPDSESQLADQTFYKVLTLSCLPLYALCLFSSLYFLWQWSTLSTFGQVLYVLSVGVTGAVIAINVGHELIHKNTQLEKISGGLLFSLVCYAGFKIEHIYGHHVHVSTPQDASSSRLGQSLYEFLPRAYKHNFLNAWKLQKVRLAKKGHGLLSIYNELIWYYAASIFTAVLMGAFFEYLGGHFLMGIGFFLLQSFVAITFLEIINYIEHYGLHRNKEANGKYQRVDIQHSWNSNYFLTNMFLFQLQRHSDHHAYAARRYQVLRHHEESPQLPFGYATMFLIALIPPLWKAIMDPKVMAYYQGETLGQPLQENQHQTHTDTSLGQL